jgi:hypothetical protein
MSYGRINNGYSVTAFVAVIAIAALLCSACTNAEKTGTTANVNSNANVASSANANTSSTTASATPLEAREPERYSVTTTITIQPTGNAPQTNIPSLKFAFAKIGTERRVSFKLPDPVGEVVYLEKSPLKYLIFPTRNQFVELDPQELGFQLGDLMSPATLILRLKERTQFENMGTENVNGRTAAKYRFKAAADTHTKVGTAQADSIVYVDQETGLPLRSEIETTSSSGTGARILTAADTLTLNPEASLFEVPTGMKKVTSAELKQQVQGFVSAVRGVASFLRQQVSTSPQAGGQP